MSCLVCKNLERAFKTKHQEYIEACSTVYCRISSKFAAYKNVDMERAWNELEEHRLVCGSVSTILRFPPADPLFLTPPKGSLGGSFPSVAKTF